MVLAVWHEVAISYSRHPNRILNNRLEKSLNDREKVFTTEIISLIHKIKSVQSILYVPFILELYDE